MAANPSAQLATRLNGSLSRSHFDAGEFDPVRVDREAFSLEPRKTKARSRLRARIDEFVTADRQRDACIAILLHELRSPLASIQNAIGALRIGSKDEAFQEHMHELIARQVRQIVRLTSGLGQPHGASLENLQIRRQRMDLCTVLSRAAETVSSEIAQRQHQISLGLPEAGIWVLGDAGRLEEVFINLFSNASKYSDVGASIATSVHVADGHVEVQVCDSGIGIAADSLPHIFDLFVRAESISVQSRPGLGIGLALVRSIVETHCGTVSAVSAGPGQGSKFTVRLEILS